MTLTLQESLSKQIKAKAGLLGFTSCGISKVRFLEEEAPLLEKWLQEGKHGQMKYMEANFDKRLNPALLVDDAKSIITVLLNYFPKIIPLYNDNFKISKYAYGKDYHYVIKEKLGYLMSFIQTIVPQVKGRAFSDSAPILDKAWAKISGLGWIGKHSNLITRYNGSYQFIGHLIIDCELKYDNNIISDHCGNCTRCIDACPTGAIIKPYIIDSTKCISYLTIEYKNNLPITMQDKMEGWIFGCDICMDVCPYNKKVKPHNEPYLEPDTTFIAMTPQAWIELTEQTFKQLFKSSAVKRTKFDGLRRNIDFVIKNKKR